MKRNQLVVIALALACLVAGRSKLFSQQNSSQETYKGQPVYQVGKGVTAPRVKFSPDPEYTDAERRRRTQGVVAPSVIVTKDGRTADIKVTSSFVTRDMEDEAIKAVSRWKFEPATKDGEPVTVRIAIQIMFHLY
jgi:periplasmic protein TonB